MNRIGPKIHANRPRVVAFGGAKGGAGRSTLCAEVARALARHNQRVLCVDVSWACPTLNTLLHAEEARFNFGKDGTPPLGAEGSHLADFITSTASKNVWLVSISTARQFPFVRPRLGADVLIAQLHELDFDWILLDLSAGLDPLDVGLFTLSDIPIIVATPEPAAVRMATQYLRSAFYQALGYHPEAQRVRQELLDMLYEQPLNMNLDSLLRSTGGDPAVEEIILSTGRRFDTYLVINLVREGSERDLGGLLCHAWHQELNIFPRTLASIEYEDRRWFYNRRTSGLGPNRGDETLARDTEELVRNLLEISLVDARSPRPVPRGDGVHPALQLGMSPETPKNELRQRYRRLWESYRREETVALVFSDPDERRRISDELERQYREVLTMSGESFGDPKNASTPPRPAATSPQRPAPPSAAKPKRDAAPQPPPPRRAPAPKPAPKPDEPASQAAPKPTPPPADLPSPGAQVAELRRQANLSLQELSLRTHIGIKFLMAIEDVDLEVLPRPVYLRGYLREIARIFEIEAQPLIDSYFRYLDY